MIQLSFDDLMQESLRRCKLVDEREKAEEEQQLCCFSKGRPALSVAM
jgi:hypothetical protein